MDIEPYGRPDDTDMRLVNMLMQRSDADRLIEIANRAGTSRSAMLRNVARQIISEDDSHE